MVLHGILNGAGYDEATISCHELQDLNQTSNRLSHPTTDLGLRQRA